MSLNATRARQLLAVGDLRKLFVEELGWDRHSAPLQVTIGNASVSLAALAHKRGMVAYQCAAPEGGRLPDYAERRKIEHQVAKSAHEHLIVFTDAKAETYIWQWVKREPGKPAACREHAFHKSQSGDALLQKLQAVAFTLEEEEQLSLTDVTQRARSGFDVEKVTKRFYDRFQKEHAAFLKFIAGITERADHEWYASVMLNRLMFVYFIQRKGFLDGDHDYLRNRLKRMRDEHGKDKFYSFYRYFLVRLFHEGFGGRKRSAELEKLVGRIPYLNGGLFDVHELEKDDRYGKDIEIPDKAFERIFDFFDAYQWHLDERPLRKDDEINPDVLGYIFEKYINQKQMGAYYTKEDITEYIGKNTVLPFLLDAARAKCKVAFENSKGPTVWDLLRRDPDRYIYAAVRHGAGEPLPQDVAAGLNPPTLHQPVGEGPVKTLELRKGWNRPAPSTHALPTETWREVIARRTRYEEVKAKLAAGEVREVNDLITLNLDIRQFVQDAVESCEGPDLLRAFWHAIEKVTILDPTCGSGAFLFAALNILEPLYEACLERMEAFVGDLDRSGEKHRPEKFSDFRKVLANVVAHPNRRYFIFKSIILNNLFGVDIMEEAVEICKLRLFLKLAAQVEPDAARDNLGIEPLPDIDFNIRAGNTLVGYATYDEVKRAVGSKFDFDNALDKISVKAADLQQAFDAFRARQVEGDGSVPTEDKQELRKRLNALDDELNHHLASDYGVASSRKEAYAKWRKSHLPFHWFVEFYGIVTGGGFDVIIGNPPYVEYAKVEDQYTIRGLKTESCGNLYAYVVERSFDLACAKGRIGLIVPISIAAAQRMSLLQNLLVSRSDYLVLANFGLRPAALFPGVMQRLTIFVSSKGTKQDVFTSEYVTWYAEERSFLFSILKLFPLGKLRQPYSIPKTNNANAHSALSRILSKPRPWIHYNQFKGDRRIYYHNAGGYWIKTFNFRPYYKSLKDSEKKRTTISELSLPTASLSDIYLGILNSSLFYFFWKTLTDARHVYPSDIAMLPISLPLKDKDLENLRRSVSKLMEAFQKNRRRITYGDAQVDQFDVAPAKPILDEVDQVLARHYGFTEEELDFIVNYDIKYRMGGGVESEEE